MDLSSPVIQESCLAPGIQEPLHATDCE